MNDAVNNLCIFPSTMLSHAGSLVAHHLKCWLHYQEVMGLNPDKSTTTSRNLDTKKDPSTLLSGSEGYYFTPVNQNNTN